MKYGLILLACLFAAPLVPAYASDGDILSVLDDFESQTYGDKGAAIIYWSWTAEQKANATDFSRIEIVPDTPFGNKCMKLTVTDLMPWGGRSFYVMKSFGIDYLPPETDAVRLRLKVLRGKISLSFGSPTVYFGHSDVRTIRKTFTPTPDGQWQTVEVSLNHLLNRNFRRAGFAKDAPLIYYTRWIQEPLFLNIWNDSDGEVLIDQVELIAHGQGQPYPTFTPAQITTIAPIADFEDPADMTKAFTVMHEPVNRSGDPVVPRANWAPPTFDRVQQGESGQYSLQTQHIYTEEVLFTGVKAIGSAEANAITLNLKVQNTKVFNELVLDFIVYVAPEAQRATFPWAQLQPPPSWIGDPLAFTYYMARTDMTGISYGFYHIRRAFVPNQWTTIVLPFADFINVYGQGDCQTMFTQQQPLKGENIIAIAFCAPFRQRGGPTTTTVDSLSFVSVPGTPQEHRSFWQQPDLSKVNMVMLPGYADNGGVKQMYDLEAIGEVVGCHVFYNNSVFDGNNTAANADDDNAIAHDKSPLRPGNTAAFNNYTSFFRGLNGIMLDLHGLTGTPTSADFEFKVGNDDDVSQWQSAPAPAISVRQGAGVNNADRITFIWPDSAMNNTWLQIRVKATPVTDLPADEIFYFGNAVGESGNQPGLARVDTNDEIAARQNPHKSTLNPALIDNPCDFNRDGKVDTMDEVIARIFATTFLNDLKLITVPEQN